MQKGFTQHHFSNKTNSAKSGSDLPSTTFEKSKSGAGFTLIETLVYIALFAIIIGGGMVAAYQIIQSTSGGNNHVIMEEEANFLLRKINWALTGATSVSAPTSTSLVTTKNINGVLTTLTFSASGGNITLKRNAGSATTLNSSSISISGSPIFLKTTVSGKPDAISTTFTLTTVQNGKNVTESFSTTKYLRK